MNIPPVELSQRSSTLALTWQAYRGAPSFDRFVEFAVTLNSFAEYLLGRGFAGLHQIACELEQLALTRFGDPDTHPIDSAAMEEIERLVFALGERIGDFLGGHSRPIEERREQARQEVAEDLSPAREVWLVSAQPSLWQELVAQLGYFGVHLQVLSWDGVPTTAPAPNTLLVDLAGLLVADWQPRLRQLRHQFMASSLVGIRVDPAFITMQAALAAGCTICLPRGTGLPAIVAKILEFNAPQDEAPYRVLVVEDSQVAIRSIQRTLREHGIESEAISDPTTVLDALRRLDPDLILMDMHMPTCSGVEAARIIRQHAQFLSVPIVYLSGDADISLQIEALRLGGDHFLTKPVNPVWLAAIVKSKIARYRELRNSMLCDSLTGLLNHTSSKRRLDAAVSEAIRQHRPFTVGMIDIDHFKRINDSYGHPTGDQVIRSLAWLLRQRLRRLDIIGRYGGEEFIVGLHGTDPQLAIQVLDRIREDFSRIRHPNNETWFSATFSAGLAGLPHEGGSEGLVKAADEALYRSKRQGRNQVQTA
jgi:diguanylate cyclase (GGDEF)-like protein